MSATLKLRSVDEVARLCEQARERGRTVVLCNGVFDLLHVGHLRYLEGARRLADLVVVAINSDASVRENRGPGRPIVPEAERAELVAGLWCVDVVTVFDDPDVRGLLRTLRPNVHAKGSDYTPDTVPERDVAAELGARVVITGDPKLHAATDLIARVRALAGPAS